MTRLAICPECSRHVRATESSCPFCSLALSPGSLASRTPGATRGLKRAALFALSAVAATACGEEDKGNDNTMQPSMTGSMTATSSTTTTTTTTTSEPTAQPVYGAPVGVGGTGNVGMGGMNDPGQNPVAVYGAPPSTLDNLEDPDKE